MPEVSAFVLAVRLNALIQAGRWPGSGGSVNSQNLPPPLVAERVHLFVPVETMICLMPPPFRTIADHAKGKMSSIFWWKYGALDAISPDLAVIIADFGIGSDAPITLDYQESASQPVV